MMKLAAVLAWILLVVVAFSLGRLDPERGAGPAPGIGELQAALEESGPLDRATLLTRYLEGLSPANVEEAAELIELNQRFFTQSEHLLLMTAWTRFDPESALSWASSQEGRLQKRATLAVVQAIARNDPEAARELVEERGLLPYSDDLRDHLVRGWAQADDLGALTEYIGEIESSGRRETATTILSTELLKRGSSALTEWAESVPENAPGGLKKLAFQTTTYALAVLDPVEAAGWIQVHLEHEYARRMLEDIARRWAARSLESALDWLIALPPSNERDKAAKELFQQSLRRRPDRAEAWVRASAPKASADPLVRVIVQRDYWERPASALEWSKLISDDEIRGEVQMGVGRSWFSRAPEEVRAWLPDSGLELTVQDVIMSPE